MVFVMEDKEKSLWEIIAEQKKKYGNISTPEVDWGKDIELIKALNKEDDSFDGIPLEEFRKKHSRNL